MKLAPLSDQRSLALSYTGPKPGGALGEVVGIMASSGYGKTTLVNLLADYLSPIREQVTVAGRSLTLKRLIPVDDAGIC